MGDITAIYRLWLSNQGLDEVDMVGLGFGGWIGAEMAMMAPASIAKVILVGAMGIQPSGVPPLSRSQNRT